MWHCGIAHKIARRVTHKATVLVRYSHPALCLLTTMGAAASTPVQQSRNAEDVSEKLSSLRLDGERSPLSSDGAISKSNVSEWEDKVANSDKIQLSRTILVGTDFKNALVSRKGVVADAHVFNNQLEFKTDPITSQKSSGRCWLFATTNVLRYDVMKKLNLDDFQLSQVCN